MKERKLRGSDAGTRSSSRLKVVARAIGARPAAFSRLSSR